MGRIGGTLGRSSPHQRTRQLAASTLITVRDGAPIRPARVVPACLIQSVPGVGDASNTYDTAVVDDEHEHEDVEPFRYDAAKPACLTAWQATSRLQIPILLCRAPVVRRRCGAASTTRQPAGSICRDPGGAVGIIRRLTFDELDPDLRQALVAKVERLGYLGEFFAVGGHQPAATAAFQAFTEALKAALGAELTEAVALAVAAALGNDYERTQHERLSGALGFPVAWIAAATGRGDPAELGEAAQAARRLALAVVADYGRGAADELARTVDILGEERAVGVLLTVGRYVAHAAVANTLELAAPVQGVVDATGGALAARHSAAR